MAVAGLNLTLRQWDSAVAAFARASGLDPQLEQPWIMQIRIKSALSEFEAAQRTLAEAREKLPESTPLLFEAVNLAMVQGDAKAAITALQQIVAIEPGQFAASLQISSLAVAAGDLLQARRAADNAVQREPTSAEAYLMSAIAHYLGGEIETAKGKAQRAVELVPGLKLPVEIEILLKRR